jgi:hypothetical protein
MIVETQMHSDQKEHAHARPNRHWLRLEPVAAHQYHPRASLLICVHLRFHFLVPEQVRYRRGGTIATSGASTAPLFATNDQTLFFGSATGRAGCADLCPDRRLSEPRSEQA